MEYRRCNRCLMDTEADANIIFDKDGNCKYCTEALAQIHTTTYFPDGEGQRRLQAALRQIKADGEGKPYDCVMGISGGLDSSYLTYLGYKWGLRILAFHVDDGYDTAISKNNIHKLCTAANIDLRVIKPDAEQYNALILAYLEAGVPGVALPQDNTLFAYLYDEILSSGVKYFLGGGNFALECILQQGHTHSALDLTNLKDIHKKFGTRPINKLKFVSSCRKYWLLKTKRMVDMRLLNYVDYNRNRAFAELKEFCGFEYYGRKHLENILTAFVQLYWLPKKFGADKRVSHLSSMIVSGQMTREEALAELEEPLYDETMMAEYIDFIKQRLGMSDADFGRIMASPAHEHTDYKIDKLDPFIRKFLTHR